MPQKSQIFLIMKTIDVNMDVSVNLQKYFYDKENFEINTSLKMSDLHEKPNYVSLENLQLQHEFVKHPAPPRHIPFGGHIFMVKILMLSEQTGLMTH